MSESRAVTQEALQKEHRKRWDGIRDQMREMCRTGRRESGWEETDAPTQNTKQVDHSG